MDDETINSFMSDVVLKGLELVSEEHRPDFREYFKFQHHKLTELDGCRLWPGFQAETAKYVYDTFTPKEGDVLVSSYPKTGITWTTAILRHLFYHNDKKLQDDLKAITHFYSYLEYGPVSKYKVMDNLNIPRRYFGTHVPAKIFNFEKFRKHNVKIIYLIRNPKDQVVSWCQFSKKHPFMKFCPELHPVLPEDDKSFYDIYIAGKQQLFAKRGEGYLEHVRDWYEHKNDPNVLIVAYEDMKQNVQREIRRIADFVEFDVTDDVIAEVANMTSFSSMKQAADSASEHQNMQNRFRSGKVGDWKNHLTVAQSELIDRKVEEILGHTDIKFKYED